MVGLEWEIGAREQGKAPTHHCRLDKAAEDKETLASQLNLLARKTSTSRHSKER